MAQFNTAFSVNKILTLAALVILCLGMPAHGSEKPKEQPKPSLYSRLKGWARGEAASVLPPIQITLTEQLSKRIDDILDQFTKVIEGSSHLRNLLQIKEKLDTLVKTVSDEVHVRTMASAQSSAIDIKHSAEQKSTAAASAQNVLSVSQETPILVNHVKKELIQLRVQLDGLISKFSASNKDLKEQSEENALKDELFKEISKFKERLSALITTLETSLDVPQLRLIFTRLQEIQTEYNTLVSTFKNKSLGGLYGTLEKNIKELGSTLTKLSTKLSAQMRTELQQVIGFPALQLLKNRIENDIALVQTAETFDTQKFKEKLSEYETLIASVLSTIANNDKENNENNGKLQNELVTLQKTIDDIKQNQTLTKESGLAYLNKMKSHIGLILGANNGLNSVCQSFLHDFKEKTIPALAKAMGEQLEKSSEKILDKGLSTFKRGALYATCLAVAAYSTFYTMTHYEKPAQVKIGLSVLAASIAYPIIDGARTFWAWLTYKENKTSK